MAEPVMNSTIALILAVQAILIIGIPLWAASRKDKRDSERRIKEKEADYERQDEVAAAAEERAAKVARLLIEAQQETIRRTEEVARAAAEADERIRAQLIAIDEQGKKIHILVNSDMTAARTAERNAMKLLVVALKQARPTSKELNDEIEHAETRVIELDQILADRHAAQLRVDAESEAQENKHEKS